jgi:hypothetical protein
MHILFARWIHRLQPAEATVVVRTQIDDTRWILACAYALPAVEVLTWVDFILTMLACEARTARAAAEV